MNTHRTGVVSGSSDATKAVGGFATGHCLVLIRLSSRPFSWKESQSSRRYSMAGTFRTSTAIYRVYSESDVAKRVG